MTYLCSPSFTTVLVAETPGKDVTFLQGFFWTEKGEALLPHPFF